MQLQSGRTSPPHPSARETIPYTSAALRQDLERIRGIWDDCQASRDRNAIYSYLSVVYGLLAWWTAEGRETDRARRALRLQRLEVSDREDPFAAIIRCTADPAKADKRTRSKWSRAMRYAAAYKPDAEPLDHFIRRKGGINAAAVDVMDNPTVRAPRRSRSTVSAAREGHAGGARRVSKGRDQEMVADHQGVRDQGGMSPRRRASGLASVSFSPGCH
jgi:hypothetical protein